MDVLQIIASGEIQRLSGEQIATILIALFGGSGGIVVIVRAYLDHKRKILQMDDDAEIRLLRRIEKSLEDAQKKSEYFELQLEKEKEYNAHLVTLLAQNGILPPRKSEVLK